MSAIIKGPLLEQLQIVAYQGTYLDRITFLIATIPFFIDLFRSAAGEKRSAEDCEESPVKKLGGASDRGSGAKVSGPCTRLFYNLSLSIEVC